MLLNRDDKIVQARIRHIVQRCLYKHFPWQNLNCNAKVRTRIAHPNSLDCGRPVLLPIRKKVSQKGMREAVPDTGRTANHLVIFLHRKDIGRSLTCR